jgi:hypothetical protein
MNNDLRRDLLGRKGRMDRRNYKRNKNEKRQSKLKFDSLHFTPHPSLLAGRHPLFPAFAEATPAYANPRFGGRR